MAVNIIFGIQIASSEGIEPLMAKVDEIVENNTYMALKAIPTPRCNPVPPRTLRYASDTPMRVSISAANGIAKRLLYSFSNICEPGIPRSFCRRR